MTLTWLSLSRISVFTPSYDRFSSFIFFLFIRSGLIDPRYLLESSLMTAKQTLPVPLTIRKMLNHRLKALFLVTQ